MDDLQHYVRIYYYTVLACTRLLRSCATAASHAQACQGTHTTRNMPHTHLLFTARTRRWCLYALRCLRHIPAAARAVVPRLTCSNTARLPHTYPCGFHRYPHQLHCCRTAHPTFLTIACLRAVPLPRCTRAHTFTCPAHLRTSIPHTYPH